MNIHSWSFIIVAAGYGSRIGGKPKQFRILGDNPLWKWSAGIAEKLWTAGKISELVLVVPEEYCEVLKNNSDFKIPMHVVGGGKTRSESVMNGLRICSGSHVLVHDGARPFLTEKLCSDLIAKADMSGSAIPVIPSADSLKKIENKKIVCADRKYYFRTQTPQAFEKNHLCYAMQKYGLNGTDEAAAWVSAGYNLYTVEGEDSNMKITTPFDWKAAEALVSSAEEIRTGHGYDIHRLVPGRRLILAGKEITSDSGLQGHSDADIVTHTVMDAILGAAGEPDIGTIFPASDERWKDAASTDMLVSVVDRIRSKGWKIKWVDVTLEAQTPKLGHLVQSFISNLSGYLAEPGEIPNFNMKVKSGEGCGSVGRGECMVCHGVATLTRNKYNLEAFYYGEEKN